MEDFEEYYEQLRPKRALTDKQIGRLAQRIDDHNFKVQELIDRVKMSGHPLGEKLAQAFTEDCLALNSAKMTVEGYLKQ